MSESWSYFFLALTTFATIAAYLPSIRGPYVWDDLSEIADNPAIRTLLPPWRPMFAGGELPHRPIPYFTFALNYAVGRVFLDDPLDPLPFHVVNLLIHLTNGAVLFWIVRHLLALRPPAVAAVEIPPALTGLTALSTPTAWVAATLWLVHPLQTQAVSYIYQRIELLAALAALMTFAAFFAAAASRTPLPWVVAAVVACGLGMGCKEWMIVVPVIVLLADRAFLASSWREIVARRGPWHAALFATVPILLSIVAQQRARYPEAAFSPWQMVLYAINQPTIILWYLSRLVLPVGQSLDHGAVLRQAPFGRDAWLLVPAAAVIGVAVWSLVTFPRHPRISFMPLAFLLLLAPTSSVLPVQDACVEHRMYLASALPLTAAAIGLCRLTPQPLPVAAGLVLALAAITASRNTVYATAVDVWRDAAAKSGGSSRSLSRLGSELSKLDRHAEAIAAGEAAVRRNPANPVPYAALAAALLNADRLEEAAAVCQAGLRTSGDGATQTFSDPVLDRLSMYLGIALSRRGDPQGEQLLRRAVARRPDSLAAREHLARAVVKTDPEESARLWASLLATAPGDPYILFNLGSAVARFDPDRAVAILSATIARDSANPDAYNNLGGVLLALGRRDEAVRAYEECLRLDPDHPQAAANLAALGSVSAPGTIGP